MARGRRLLLLALLLPVGAGLAYLGYVLVLDAYFYPGSPAARFPPPAGTAEARRQDLEYFRHFLTLERSYTADTRAAAEAVIADLETRVAALSDAAFELGIARAVALADNGHSNVWVGRFSRKHGRVPVRLYWFADGPHVVRADGPWSHLLGARLERVGDVPLHELTVRLESFVGGTPEAFRAYRGPALLELPAALHAVGAAATERAADYTFELNGAPLHETLPGQMLADDQTPAWPHAYLSPGRREGEPAGWVALADGFDPPLYLQEPDTPFRMVQLGEGVLYVQYRQNVDAEGHDIGAFGRRVRAGIGQHAPSVLIVDHRFNSGGDYTTTASLMQSLPGLVPGGAHIYLVTGNATFSAGIYSVAYTRAAGREEGVAVTIIGERIGDLERAWGETNDFELPNSRLGITFSTGLHDVAKGCYEWPQCYWTNFFHNVAAGQLDPDVRVPTRFADFAAGRDPVLEAILAAPGAE